jgi:uncharacterized protein YkwD
MNLGGTTALLDRRALALVGVAAVVLVALLAAGPGASSAIAGQCANADATPAEATVGELRNAIVCLINDKRRDRDKRRLDKNAKLKDAAVRHNRTMLRENCWRHKCPGEPTLQKRLRRSGYLDGASSWAYAENFGCAQTPQGMLNAWMDSRFHRKNILGSYEDIGAAAAKEVVPSSPCGSDRATYTVVLASRSG